MRTEHISLNGMRCSRSIGQRIIPPISHSPFSAPSIADLALFFRFISVCMSTPFPKVEVLFPFKFVRRFQDFFKGSVVYAALMLVPWGVPPNRLDENHFGREPKFPHHISPIRTASFIHHALLENIANTMSQMTVAHNRLRAVPDHVYVPLHSARSSCECVQSCLCVSYVQPALPLRFYVPESFSSSYIYYTPARALKREGNGSERSRESTLWKGLPPTEEEDCDQKLWKQIHACYSYILNFKLCCINSKFSMTYNTKLWFCIQNSTYVLLLGHWSHRCEPTFYVWFLPLRLEALSCVSLVSDLPTQWMVPISSHLSGRKIFLSDSLVVLLMILALRFILAKTSWRRNRVRVEKLDVPLFPFWHSSYLQWFLNFVPLLVYKFTIKCNVIVELCLLFRCEKVTLIQLNKHLKGIYE